MTTSPKTDKTLKTGPGPGMSPGAVVRYSLIFAVMTVPASFVFLGLPVAIAAVWIIARRIADRYQRQLTAAETFKLALASWGWMFLTSAFEAVGTGTGAALVLMLPWQIISLATVWAAYVWLARYVIRRRLGLDQDTSEKAGADEILAQQEERYAEATARSLTMGVAWLTVGLFGMFGLLIVIGLVAVILTLIGVEVGGGFMFFAMAISMPAILAGWVYLIQKKTSALFPSRRLVLWLRRFHRTDLMEFPFPAFLERVCRGVAVPITLQDSTVASARTAATLRPSYYLLVGLQMSCWFAIFVSLLLWSDHEPNWDIETIMLAILTAVAIGGLVGAGCILPHLGVVRLDTKRGQKLVTDLTEAIERKQGVPQTLTIVSTPDETWQEWVLYFLIRSDVVLIDVTHLSENLYWELHQLREHMKPEQVIFAYGAPEGTNPEIPADMLAELEGILGEPMLEGSQRFFYEVPKPSGLRKLSQSFHNRNGWLQPSRTLRRRYTRSLIEALNNGLRASDCKLDLVRP
jgi:hypothetical protein